MSAKVDPLHAVAVMKAAELKPLEEYVGGKEKWKCKCLLCGLIVYPRYSSILRGQGGCRECGLKRSAALRRTDEKAAIKLMKKAGVTPQVPYTNSSTPWKSLCNKCGKQVSPQYGSVKAGRQGCIYCAKKKIDPSDAKFQMKEFGFKPLVDYPGANTPWRSIHLACGEKVAPRLTELLSGRGGCMKCGWASNKAKQLGDPTKARKLFLSRGLEPLVDYPGSGRPWKSKCLTCKRTVYPQYGRVKDGTGCAYCAGKMVVPEEAVATMIAADLKPLVRYPGTKTAWKSKCLKCGKIVETYYSDVLHNGTRCKYCVGKAVDPSDAIRLMKQKKLIPQVPFPGSMTKWHCRCAKCNKDVYPAYNSIQQGSGGCKYCAKVFIDVVDAVSVMEAANLLPLVKYPGSKKPWKCKCLICGHIVSPQHGAITGGQGPCRYCARKSVDPKEARQFMIEANLRPLEPYSRADSPWKCRCLKCKKIVTPSYSSIGSGQGGCKYCAIKGIDYNQPAFIYLITNSKLGAHKIGIGNEKTKNNRLKEHARFGWEVFKTKRFESGELAEAVEQDVLRWLRDVSSLPVHLTKAQLPQGGFTETVDASLIELQTIWRQILKVSRSQAI